MIEINNRTFDKIVSLDDKELSLAVQNFLNNYLSVQKLNACSVDNVL